MSYDYPQYPDPELGDENNNTDNSTGKKAVQKVGDALEALGDITLTGYYNANHGFWSVLGYKAKKPSQQSEEFSMHGALPYSEFRV